MIAGDISHYGLNDLIMLRGNINDFQYAQALFNHKENIDNFNKKYNCNLIFNRMEFLRILIYAKGI